MREIEAKDLKLLKLTKHILKEDILNPNMSKKLAKLEGRKLQGDSIEVLWSTELPVTQITAGKLKE